MDPLDTWLVLGMCWTVVIGGLFYFIDRHTP